MNASDLFAANLGLIDRIIAIVCRRAGLFGPDAEDFASEAKLALIEDDYAILRKYEGRSALETYLTVVIRRLLADMRTRTKGRWHASSEAERLGPVAVMVETLVRRDGRTLDDALTHIRATEPDVTREKLEELLRHLPERTGRPRAVDLEKVAYAVASGEHADARAVAGDLHRLSAIAGNALREKLEELPTEDRVLLRLRYASEMTIADISRMMQLPQRPLYRRLESLLGRLRGALTGAGIDRRAAAEIVGSDATAIDLGFGKSPLPGPSIDAVVQQNAREDS